MGLLLQVLGSLVVVFVVSRFLKFQNGRKRTGHLPGMRSLLSPVSALGASFPTGRFNPGRNWQWEWRKDVYSRAGTETISVLPYLFGVPAVYTTSLEVARQVVATKGQFHKTRDITEITLLWGPNVFSENGDEWKRHRRILTPAFDNETFAALWKETSRVFDEMIVGEGWADKKSVDVPLVNSLTNKFALILISTSGFGNRIPWRFENDAANGGMSFGEALTIFVRSYILHLLIPKWAFQLPIRKLREADRATKTVLSFMRTLIDERRKDLQEGKPVSHDILSLMIQSSETEGKFSMSEPELVGNTFILLFAGHDTTALTLNAALALLAIHEDYQEEVHREVMEVMPTDEQFTFENSSKLTKVVAAFLEASRLFPAGPMLIRDTAEDIILRNIGPNRDEVVAIPEGTRFVVDMIGVHYNARQYPDPEEYKPERWYGVQENNITMFSVGSRACIGRRFAVTEATCFLARLLRGWRVERLAKEGETKEQWRERVIRGESVMNFGIGDVPLRFVKR